MQNMAVLIDTNVLLNYITNREDVYLEPSVKIIEMCAKGELQGYIIMYPIRWTRQEEGIA